MKKTIRRVTMLCLAFVMTVTMSFVSADSIGFVTSQDTVKAKVTVDWNTRYSFSELEYQLKSLNKAYPEFSTLETIGTSTEGRGIWCMTITNEAISNSGKTQVSIFGNIHGDEREAGSCAMYAAWYLLENSDVENIADILDEYVIYVIPVINPDGYEQSAIFPQRENVNLLDHDGDGIASNDDYKDINGDGLVSLVQAVDGNKAVTGVLGYESADGNKDGILANDVKNSGVDLNRNFDYLWGQDGKMDTEGPSAASEPETKAVQSFISAHKNMACLTTLHTGIQCVLYPWCWRDASKDLDDMDDINYMSKVSEEVTKDIAAGTQRNFYYKSSYRDYQTYSELIDYSYGKYGIHSYTIEVYRQDAEGDSTYNPNRDFTSDKGCSWDTTAPDTNWDSTKTYYTHEEAAAILKTAGIDVSKLKVKDAATGKYRAWGSSEGLLFETDAWTKLATAMPKSQDVMVKGVMDGLLTMIKSEPTKADVKATTVSGLKAKASSGKVKLTWSKSDLYVDGYQVYKSTKKTSGYSKVSTTSKTTVTTSKGLKKGKTFYYRVRTYKKVSGTTYYGKWTRVSVKAK